MGEIQGIREVGEPHRGLSKLFSGDRATKHHTESPHQGILLTAGLLDAPLPRLVGKQDLLLQTSDPPTRATLE